MPDGHEHVLVAVELDQLVDRLLCLHRIHVPRLRVRRDAVEGRRARARRVRLRVARREEGARAGQRQPLGQLRLGGDGLRHGDVRGGLVRARVVADVAAQEDECVRGRAHEARDVSRGVARDVEEVEAAVSEEVVRPEPADPQRVVELDLPDVAALEVGREERRLLAGRVAGQEGLLEGAADDDVDALREQLDVAYVVPAEVAPDDRIDRVQLDTSRPEDLGDVVRDPQPRDALRGDRVEDRRREVPPVLARAEGRRGRACSAAGSGCRTRTHEQDRSVKVRIII